MDAEPCVLPCKIEHGGTILGGFGAQVGHLGPPGRARDPIWGGSGPHVGHLVQNPVFYDESGRPCWPLGAEHRVLR